MKFFIVGFLLFVLSGCVSHRESPAQKVVETTSQDVRILIPHPPIISFKPPKEWVVAQRPYPGNNSIYAFTKTGKSGTPSLSVSWRHASNEERSASVEKLQGQRLERWRNDVFDDASMAYFASIRGEKLLFEIYQYRQIDGSAFTCLLIAQGVLFCFEVRYVEPKEEEFALKALGELLSTVKLT